MQWAFEDSSEPKTTSSLKKLETGGEARIEHNQGKQVGDNQIWLNGEVNAATTTKGPVPSTTDGLYDLTQVPLPLRASVS